MFIKKIIKKVIKVSLFITTNYPLYLYGNTLHENIQNFNNIVDEIYNICTDNDISKEQLESNLEDFYKNPLDINFASTEDLEKLCILSEEQIIALQNHKKKYGLLLSIYELQVIPEFDLKTIYRIIPFVRIEESRKDLRNSSLLTEVTSIKNNRISFQYKKTFLTKEELKEWYKLSSKTGMPAHLGPPDEFITKIRIRHPSGYELGISAKKSLGEEFIWDNKSKRYGFNVYRIHFMIQDKGILKNLILGNYELGYGQGLVVSSGFFLGQGGETIKVIKTANLGIKAYISPKEIKFCGIASTLQLNLWELTTYYSFVNLDENQVDKNTNNEHVESQVYRTCNYDNYSKIEKRNSLTEQVFGATLLYNNKKINFEMGLNFIFTLFDKRFWPKSKVDKTTKNNKKLEDKETEINEETKNKFSGTQNLNSSLFYRYVWRNIHLFGEQAFSKNLSGETLQIQNICPAFINGIVMSLHKTLDMTFLYRYYSTAYNCFYGNPLKASTHPKNEHGFYTGLRYKPLFEWTLDTLYDFVYIPEPITNQKPFVTTWMIRTNYEIYKLWTISLQYSQKTKDVKTTKEENRSYDLTFAEETIRKIRLKSTYFLSSRVSLKNELHINRYNKVGSITWGYGLIQDISYKTNHTKYTTRIGWFDPQTYKNTIHCYEPNLLNAGRGTAQYTKKGIFFCFLICYKPTAEWRIELKYSHMQKFEEETSSQSQNKPYNEIRNSIEVQIIYMF